MSKLTHHPVCLVSNDDDDDAAAECNNFLYPPILYPCTGRIKFIYNFSATCVP